jgi:hypothetical protein
MSDVTEEWKLQYLENISKSVDFLGGIVIHLERISSPAAIFKPKVFPDGNMWCALLGENLHDGVAGFGATPEEAIQDFDREWASAKCPKPKDSYDRFPYERRQLKRREEASMKAARQAESEH